MTVKGTKERSGPRPGERARRWMMDHPHDTIKEVAEACACSDRVVSYQRRRMIERKEVPADHFTRSNYAKMNDPANVAGSAPTHEGLGFKDANLSTEESLKMLTTLARDGYEAGNFAQAKGSIETHEKLKQRSAVSTLGPPDPQTDKEKIDRLAVIIDVCGPILTASAVLKAFWENPNRDMFFGEFDRQQSTRALGINPWGKTATGSPPIEIEDLLDGESNQSQEGPTVAPEHEESPPHSGSSDPLD